jgi:DNA-binding MarR family transcriptional regulator
VVGKLVDAVDRGRREARVPRAAEDEPVATRIVAEGVVGAVLGVLHARLLARNPKSLTGLRGQLMGMIVLPYLGPRAAAAELTRPAPRVRRAKSAREDPLRGLNMRLTYRTIRVLAAIGAGAGLSNRQVAREAGVDDQGQISKLLQRLEGLGLIHNTGAGLARGEANAWLLTARGTELEQAVRTRADRGESA